MGLTIYTKHAAASSIRLEVEAAKVEVNPVNGMVTILDPKTGDFLANVSGIDFAVMVTDAATVRETVAP